VSTDQEFAPKAADVVALYGNPPINAVVWSVEEKPSLQAIERASGYVETDRGQVVRALKSTYQRHGTRHLFAALAVGTGQVPSQFTASKKGEKFGSFLEDVLADQPPDLPCHSSWPSFVGGSRPNRDACSKTALLPQLPGS